MSEETQRALSTLKRRRGVSKASVTRLSTRLKDLETDISRPGTIDHARRMQQKLDTLDGEFQSHHQGIVDLIDNEEALTGEQSTLDEHDDLIADLSVHVNQLIAACTCSDSAPRKLATRRLAHVGKSLLNISTSIRKLGGDASEAHVLRQYDEQLIDLKKELSETRNSLLTLELDDMDDLNSELAHLEKDVFDSSVEIKQKLSSFSPTPVDSSTPVSDYTGVKLPKLDVPTFDGNILNWRSFWEQFRVPCVCA